MKDLSLYIHIPFCKNICLYCNFLTFANKNKKIPEYIEALIKEIKQRSKQLKNYRIETIYFGGGTPSLIESNYIKNILTSIKNNFNLNSDVEITIECNPESIDTKKLKDYLNYGINRISLGIQSFNAKTLKRIARPHDQKIILKALQFIKEANCTNFGTDFIMGLPYQTVKSFSEELKQILTFEPPHLSFYFLSYDTNRIDIFKKDCPSENSQIAMYNHLTKTLKENGYIHYEVSNYAKTNYECRHNLRYWEQKDYLGLGLGAHSIMNNEMFENQSDLENYIKNPIMHVNKMLIDKELKKMEYIMLHLRTGKGILKTDYEKKFHDFEILYNQAKTYITSGHLKFENQNLQVTEKGFLIVDRITKSLI